MSSPAPTAPGRAPCSRRWPSAWSVPPAARGCFGPMSVRTGSTGSVQRPPATTGARPASGFSGFEAMMARLTWTGPPSRSPWRWSGAAAAVPGRSSPGKITMLSTPSSGTPQPTGSSQMAGCSLRMAPAARWCAPRRMPPVSSSRPRDSLLWSRCSGMMPPWRRGAGGWSGCGCAMRILKHRPS